MPSRLIHSIAYGNEPRQVLDLYPSQTQAPDNQTVVIFWHGGSWKSGDKKLYRFMGSTLRGLGYTVVIPNYRLYPEVFLTGMLEDAALCVNWVKTTLKPRKIIIMGHSAGAHIASIITLEPRYLAAHGLAINHTIQGFIGLAGPYDFNPHLSLKPIFGGEPAKVWNPVQVVNQPTVPMLLLHGRRDRVVAVSNSSALASAVDANGGTAQTYLVSGLGHFGILIPFLGHLKLTPWIKRRLTIFIDSC